MRQLNAQHIQLFWTLREHCLFLTRRQIERLLTLPTNSTNKQLVWMMSEKYLARRYRADTFAHFQTPLYYLGSSGWRLTGKATDEYKQYQKRVEERAERQLDHLLGVYDVLLKFILGGKVKKIIMGEDRFWQESLSFGSVPDVWIQFQTGEVFIEVDRGTESLEVLAEKLRNYVKLAESGTFRIIFPECKFKVLLITTTEERIERLEERTTCDEIWFGTTDEFLRESLDHRHWFAYRGFYALPVVTKKAV